MAYGELHPSFDCPFVHLLSQLTLNFYERRYYGWQNSRGGEIAKRAIVNSQNKINNLFTHVFTHAVA